MSIKSFFKEISLPRNFVKVVKFQGGSILLNNKPVTVRAILNKGDKLTVIPPGEVGHDSVIPSYLPIDIIYEDRDLLVINKDNNCVSIPSIKHPDSSVANRVRGYYLESGYKNQVIHIVTRLDRDTSGLMLIAKHRLAHALLDRAIQEGKIQRYYYGISQSNHWANHGRIEVSIGRAPQSIITRQVTDQGQYALTEYWKIADYGQASLLKLKLHTGRTHQIRVHLSHAGGPLVGDDLYGGMIDKIMKRQALHCGHLELIHPFSGDALSFKADLPQDMAGWLEKQEKRVEDGNF